MKDIIFFSDMIENNKIGARCNCGKCTEKPSEIWFPKHAAFADSECNVFNPYNYGIVMDFMEAYSFSLLWENTFYWIIGEEK